MEGGAGGGGGRGRGEVVARLPNALDCESGSGHGSTAGLPATG